VDDLLGRMTIDEKIAQLECVINVVSISGKPLEMAFANGKLDEAYARRYMSNGLGTFAFLNEMNGFSGDASAGARARNELQRWVVENTRLHIPVLFHGEALHGAVVKGATSFPQAIGLGSTWDPALVEEMFDVIASEERALGNRIVLSPVFDLIRDPRYGRVEEMYSEDPFLVSAMGTAAVRGLQGTNPDKVDDRHVLATAKHFVHGQPENGTNGGPSDYSEHTMRSVFLVPFEEAVKNAHIAAVMASYNETAGGIPSNENAWLLTDVLRKEWGFEGLTLSDYGAIDQLVDGHHVAPDKAAAAVLAMNAGVDMELPMPSAFPHLKEAVQAGRVSPSRLDDAVRHVLNAKFRTGLFEHPFTTDSTALQRVGGVEHVKVARKVADEAIVLLKNDNRLLPLAPRKGQTIAIIGPNATKERLGTYSGMPSHYVSLVDGIQSRVGPGVRVVSAEGCGISTPDTASNLNTFAKYEPVSAEADKKLLSQAIEAAQKADYIVLAVGGNEVVSREATGPTDMGYSVLGDSASLDLSGRQNQLIDAIAKLGKPTVAVLLNGRPYAIPELARQVSAILEGWYLGQETGSALAAVLFGDVNPSGHLPVSMPRSVGQLPIYYYKSPLARSGYVIGSEQPLYPFGYGLSYTTFEIGEPRLDADAIRPNGHTSVKVEVKNIGSRAGDEVVQLYVHHVYSSIVQPEIILRGFKRLHLEAGASRIVTFGIGRDELHITNAHMQQVVETGLVDIKIGDDSAHTKDVRLKITN
jgi:beta-glucosidase